MNQDRRYVAKVLQTLTEGSDQVRKNPSEANFEYWEHRLEHAKRPRRNWAWVWILISLCGCFSGGWLFADKALSTTKTLVEEPQRMSTTTAIVQATALPTPLAARHFDGDWVHNFGSMHLDQNGNSVRGIYFNAFAGERGSITGSVSGNTLNGMWTITGESGPFNWTLAPDGKTFSGSYNAKGNWCGARVGQAFPDGCGFAGDWLVNLPEIGTGTMRLQQIGSAVSGTYLDGRHLEGKATYISGDAVVVLLGRWQGIEGNSGPLTLYLLNDQGLQIQGDWEEPKGSLHPWCAWRSKSRPPSPCLR